MEIVSFPFKDAIKGSCLCVHNSPYYCGQPSMENQPLQGGEASFNTQKQLVVDFGS